MISVLTAFHVSFGELPNLAVLWYFLSFLLYHTSQKVGESDYLRLTRLRPIWAESTFAVLKREHKLKRLQKRDLQKATEECLLSATALNLKRLVKAV